MGTPDIIFPNLGIEISHISPVAFSVFGLEIKWYGIFIALGILAGTSIAFRYTKRNGLSNDTFLDFLLLAIPIAILFTRLYFVIFNWDLYKDNPLKIFAFRDGGMGVYGGIIAAITTAVIFSKVKKVSLGAIGDTGVVGLIMGQVIGRIGNFINMEAFGDYTNSFLAMQYKLSNVNSVHVTQKMLDNLVIREGVQYIQVHPTFLYEALWNLGLFIILNIYRKHKKFQGELLVLYCAGYGLGRFWIESLRTDQLVIFGGVPVSMVVSALFCVGAVTFIVIKRIKIKKSGKNIVESNV